MVTLPILEVQLPQVRIERFTARCSFKQQAAQLPYVIAGGNVVHPKDFLHFTTRNKSTRDHVQCWIAVEHDFPWTKRSPTSRALLNLRTLHFAVM